MFTGTSKYRVGGGSMCVLLALLLCSVIQRWHGVGFTAMCTQCARSAHAVRTQCTRSAHAVQTLCLCVCGSWWWWWWGVCVCVCVQWVRGYLCHRNVALPRRCTFSGPTIYTLTRREGLCLCFFGGFLPSRPGVDGSECEHSQKEKWPFYGRPLPPLPGWRPMSSFSRSCSCDTT